MLLGAKCRHCLWEHEPRASQGTKLCHVAISSTARSAFLGGWLHMRLCWRPLASKLASCDLVAQCEYDLHLWLPLQRFSGSMSRQSMVGTDTVHVPTWTASSFMLSSPPQPPPLASPSGQLCCRKRPQMEPHIISKHESGRSAHKGRICQCRWTARFLQRSRGEGQRERIHAST